MVIISNLVKYIPELVILLTIFLQIMLYLINAKKIASFIVVLGFIIPILVFTNSLIYPMELYSTLFKILILISSFFIYFLISNSKLQRKSFKFNIIYLFSVFWLLMVVNSNDYITLYLNIELFSLSIYFLMLMSNDKISFSESYKYMIMSVISSSFILLGSAFLYGLIGSLNFYDITNVLLSSNNYSFSSIAIPYIFIFSGLFFKLGGYPFLNWVIDIYRNIDTKLVAYISVVPKLAVFSVLIKILNSVQSFEFTFLITVFALLSGFYGVLYSLRSKNIKELMAASSYINISYMLVALAIYTKISLSTLLFYWISYVFMNIGAFSGIIALEHSNLRNRDLDIKGYFYKNPIFSISFLTCIISLLGFPLTSGFIAKIYLISGVLNSGIIAIPLLFIMLLLMVVSVIFYIKIIKQAFCEQGYEKCIQIRTKSANILVLYACTLITLVIGFFPAWIIKICEIISLYI